MTAAPGPSLRIVAFEPFDAGSHRAVRESIARHSRHDWTWFTRPARAWKWRMRLAAFELADEAIAAGAFDRPVDVIFATSLMSAADLVAALPAPARSARVVLYMHENQAAYPRGPAAGAAARDVHFALTNLASALCADLVIWNSAWNRRSFTEGMPEILRHAPDLALPGWRERIEERSAVAWPPVEPGGREQQASRSVAGSGVLHKAIKVVWPHRWEHDKGPEELLRLAETHTVEWNLRWTILGESFRKVPEEVEAFRRRFADRIDHMGFIPDRTTYLAHLAACDWVLSTARHEFFGIAVVEALRAGCLPWLPDALSYPELLPAEARGLDPGSPPADAEGVRAGIRRHLEPAEAERAVARLDSLLAGGA